MNKQRNTLVLVGAILLVMTVGAFWLYSQNNQTDPNPTTERTNQPKSTKTTGSYQAYTLEALSGTETKERVLFFHAPWCPQCRQLEADIKKNGVPQDIAIFKVDYDSNQDLRQRYGVTLQTTVVHVDKNGNKISSFLPYEDPSLENALSGLGL